MEDIRSVGIHYVHLVHEQESVTYDHSQFLRWANMPHDMDYDPKLLLEFFASIAPLSEVVTGSDLEGFEVREVLED